MFKSAVLPTAAIASLLFLSACATSVSDETAVIDRVGDSKPDARTALALLKEGNRRFVLNHTIHPHSSFKRICLTDGNDQGKYAYATIFSCSDSRVPPELIFDAGMMDLFVVRVAGNVCHTAETGSVEYGALHVKTPVIVVLGHTQCGAVTTVSEVLKGECHHEVEANILSMVKPIVPVVEKTIKDNPNQTPKEIAALAVPENVKQSMRDLLKNSEPLRNAVRNGNTHLLGAVYDIHTREVTFLPENTVQSML